MPRIVLLVTCLLAMPSCAAEPRVEYIVHLDRPQTQTLRVELVLREVEGETVEVAMPSWRPGRYAILDPAGSVRWLRASGPGGGLEAVKTDKSHWSIATGGGDEVRVLYELYANSLGDRTRHVDETHAFLSGESVFVYDPSRRDEPAVVRLEAPESWRVSSSLGPVGGDPRVLLAPDYDTLVDSPIEVGVHDLIEFEVDGVPHEIAVWGEGGWDADRLREDFTAIVRETASIFGDMPYERYVFQVHVAPGIGGGTEHLNSTIMQTRPASFETRKDYRGFLSLVAHEFFHTWNVKRLRPAGITPYDYDRENYTKLLWVVEGTTSYYDDLIPARTGQIEIQEYLERVAGSISSFSRQGGRRVQSLEESSFDAWVKFSRHSPDSGNTTVNFYQKGALVSLLLDLELRRRTAGGVSLDGVMRAMYERFPLDAGGFSPEDLLGTVEELAGSDFDAFFADYVSGTAELDFDGAFETVGLALRFKAAKDEWAQDNAADDESGEDAGDDVRQRAWLGLSLAEQGGGVVVRSVAEDGPAFGAGVIADDELIAVNSRRVDGADLKALLGGVEPGDEVTLLLARRGGVFERVLVAGAEPDGSWEIRKIDDATPEQRAAFEAWLRQPWSEPRDEPGEDGDTE